MSAPTLTRAAERTRGGVSRLVDEHPGRVVVGAAAAMVVAQLAFRAWALLPGYFYSDDYQLLSDGRAGGLRPAAFLEPYAAQFMPYGRFVAWAVSQPERLSWPLVASTTLLAQALAGAACVWMLLTLFGARRAVLAPLALYLSSPITMPAFMWWAAGLNQVPLQAVFFGAIASWVSYLRTRSWRWLALTVLLLALGLACYVKVLLLFPVLAFLALGWFASGGPLRRLVTVVTRYWPAVVVGVAGGVAFLAYYLTSRADRLTSSTAPTDAGELLDNLLVRSWGTGALGGPWRWNEVLTPVALSDPPSWAVTLTWVVLVLAAAHVVLRRERAARALLLLAGYLGLDFAILFITRAQAVGAIVGGEYRYLTDASCIAVLAIGLACLELRGAEQSSRARAEPLLRAGLPRAAVVALTSAVVVSGLVSSWSYARIWHDDFPASDLFARSLASLPLAQRADGADGVDLANQYLPNDLTGSFGPPGNSTSFLLPLLDPQFRFPESTELLHVLDDDGRVVAAELETVATSLPGPTPGCGWQVGSAGAEIPLDADAPDGTWWVKISYLSSQDSALQVHAGQRRATVDLRQDLGTTWVHVAGAVPSVTLTGLDPGVTLCLDEIEVGSPVPAGQEPS